MSDSGNATSGSDLRKQEPIDRREGSDELASRLIGRATSIRGVIYFFEAAKRRSRCGSVRGIPVLSSHFSPGLAPHVEQRTKRARSFFVFIAT